MPHQSGTRHTEVVNMRPNNNNEEEKIAFERLVGDLKEPTSTTKCLARKYGNPTNILLEPIQESTDAYNGDELTETHTWVDTASDMPSRDFEARSLDIETEGNR